MAEKEERIFISKTDSLDGFRDENATVRGYTVQEAINRMANALCADDVMREGYYQMAEAALNALLGVGK